jgi:hypothetical protein
MIFLNLFICLLGFAQNTKPTTPTNKFNSEIYPKLLNKISSYSAGQNKEQAKEKYDSNDEFDYKVFACKQFVDARKNESYHFVRNSQLFDEKFAKANMSIFNILYQMSISKKISNDTCLDYAVDPLDSNKAKLSFAFSKSYPSGKAGQHLQETALLGFILSRFNAYNQMVKNASGTISPIENVYIHGFADQQPYAPRRKMDYLNSEKKSVIKDYGNDGLLEDMLKAEEAVFTDATTGNVAGRKYINISEQQELKKKIQDKHTVFPKFETTDQDLILSNNRYISEIEVNEFLALNRAIQTKRALSLFLVGPKSFDGQLMIGKNSTSSCKNMVGNNHLYKSDNSDFPNLNKKAETCANRRTTVVESNINSYFQYGSEFGPGAIVKGVHWSPGAYYYANCAMKGKGWSEFAEETLIDYILKTDINYSIPRDKVGKFEKGSELIHDRLTKAPTSILKMLDSFYEDKDEAQLVSDIKSRLKLRPNIRPYQNLNFPLKIEQIAKILSHPMFRFFVYPVNNSRTFQSKPTSHWNFDVNNWLSEGFLANGNKLDFSYFNHTRVYLDKECKFSKYYLPLEKENKAIDQEKILELISQEPLPVKQVINVKSENDCLVLPQNLIMVCNCNLDPNSDGDSKVVDSEFKDIIFPYMGFDYVNKPKEIKIKPKLDTLSEYVKHFGTTIPSALESVNGLLCTKRKIDNQSYSKPTSNEQADCQ